MASNEQLQAQIKAEAEKKGVDSQNTSEMSNADMAAELKRLKTEVPMSPQDDEQDDEQDDKKPPFYVCDGKSLTSKVGMIHEGKEVKAEFLHGGKDRIKELIKDGVIAKG